MTRARPTTGLRGRRTTGLRGRRWIRSASQVLILFAAVVATLPGPAGAEQASQPTSPAAGQTTTGNFHSCAVNAFTVRCWGYGGDGQLGYGNTNSIGDDETPGSVGPVDFDPGTGTGTAKAISAGNVHSCALLDEGAVRCWGFGGDGRLGYGNANAVGDDETPGSAGPVDLDPGDGLGTAKAISAGNGHSCALLGPGDVRCWGFNSTGQLGYGNTDTIGDDEPPGSVGPVDLDPGTGTGAAKAISAGGFHTCAILDADAGAEDGAVRCWGFGGLGQLGYGTAGCPAPGEPAGPCPAIVGRDPDKTPDRFGPVDLDPGDGLGTAKAISAGLRHTCAILGGAQDGAVRCWGDGSGGQLGYGNFKIIGDNETPDSVEPVDLGLDRKATAIKAGGEHTCAVLDDDSVRCWGNGDFGRLGYGNTDTIGDDEKPGPFGPVDLDPGAGLGTATAISAGGSQTCARLADDSVRCWGRGSNGRLGYCNEANVGDNESPGSVGPVDLGVPGMPGQPCPSPPPPPPPPEDPYPAALAAQAARGKAFRACLGTNPTPQRRAYCVRRYGRTPGRVNDLAARAAGGARIRLSWGAVGTDGSNPPAARSYLVKQSPRPMTTAGDFARAPSLCKGRCSFNVTRIGARLSLTITNLRRTRYYYIIKARDNVTGRLGPPSRMVSARVP